jgi:hypothetical protein
LALWVSHAYHTDHKGAYRDPIIGLGTAPLDDPTFRAAVFEQLGESRLEVPVTTDICGKKESHAIRLDAEAGEAIKKARLHRKIAATIFFESNGGQYRSGTTVPEIRLNVAEPDMDIGNVETVMEELNRTLYYLHADRNTYRFSLTPALNKLLADRLATISSAKLKERIQTEIGKVFGPGVIERVLFADKSSQVPDRPRLTMVVLSPDYPMPEPGTLPMVERMTKEYGNSARTYKSALLWVIAENASTLKDDARKVLAWEDIQDETETGSHKLDDTQGRQLRESILKARRDLKETIWRTYKNEALLDRNHELRVIDLGLVHSSAADSPMNLIINRLRQDGEIEDAISPNFLARNWPPAFKEWSTRAARDAFFASPQFPKLLNAEAIKDTVAKGVTNGIFGYVGKTGDGYTPFYFATDLPAYDVEISDDMFIITKETAEEYLRRPTHLELTPTTVTLKTGETYQFKATAYNQHNQAVPLDVFMWEATGGHIDGSGKFQAGPTPGMYEVFVSSGQMNATARVVVKLGDDKPDVQLVSIEIHPGEVHLTLGESRQFAATGIYSNGQRLPLTDVVWQSTGGKIDGGGIFTAGENAGYFEVTAGKEGRTGSATMEIRPRPVAQKWTWRGEVPPQKWTNFYMKVLTKFAANQEVKLKLRVEVEVEANGKAGYPSRKLKKPKWPCMSWG